MFSSAADYNEKRERKLQDLEAENAKLRAEVESRRCNQHKTAEPVASCLQCVLLQVGELKKALAALPCKYEGTYGSPTSQHPTFEVCPPCWARKELGIAEKRVCAKCGNIGRRQPHDEATCDYGNV
jgi:hypothetical protein